MLHGMPTDAEDRPWVLDAGCGSGTASVAAIMLGMNAYAFDMDKGCVDGTLARLSDWTSHLVDSDMHPIIETKTPKRKAADLDDDAMLANNPKQQVSKTMTDAEIEEALKEDDDLIVTRDGDENSDGEKEDGNENREEDSQNSLKDGEKAAEEGDEGGEQGAGEDGDDEDA